MAIAFLFLLRQYLSLYPKLPSKSLSSYLGLPCNALQMWAAIPVLHQFILLYNKLLQHMPWVCEAQTDDHTVCRGSESRAGQLGNSAPLSRFQRPEIKVTTGLRVSVDSQDTRQFRAVWQVPLLQVGILRFLFLAGCGGVPFLSTVTMTVCGTDQQGVWFLVSWDEMAIPWPLVTCWILSEEVTIPTVSQPPPTSKGCHYTMCRSWTPSWSSTYWSWQFWGVSDTLLSELWEIYGISH